MTHQSHEEQSNLGLETFLDFVKSELDAEMESYLKDLKLIESGLRYGGQA